MTIQCVRKRTPKDDDQKEYVRYRAAERARHRLQAGFVSSAQNVICELKVPTAYTKLYAQ